MPEPYYADDQVTVYSGDCIDVMAELPDASVDAVVTDPPYGLEFMGKEWDRPWAVTPAAATGFTGRGDNFTLPSHRDNRNANCRACGGRQRGAKRCACATPDWDRNPASDMLEFQLWCQQWAVQCLRLLKPGGHLLAFGGSRTWHRLTVAIEDAGFEIRDSIAWLCGSGFPKSLNLPGGLGTALKPAHEPIVVARKPLSGTVAGNVQAHGTGALNIDACRVAHTSVADLVESQGKNRHADFGSGARANKVYGGDDRTRASQGNYNGSAGRWPTNVVIDDATATAIDKDSGHLSGGVTVRRNMNGQEQNAHGIYGSRRRDASEDFTYGDSGGASRFFPTFRYEAKAPTVERPTADGVSHPTVKPLDLMRWLVRLVTPPNGVVLDPFAGSGTTAEACVHEYKRCIAIEREPDYLPLIVARLSKPMAVGFDFDGGAS